MRQQSSSPHTAAKKRLARRNKRVRRLLQAYTASPQPAALTSSTATAGWAEMTNQSRHQRVGFAYAVPQEQQRGREIAQLKGQTD